MALDEHVLDTQSAEEEGERQAHQGPADDQDRDTYFGLLLHTGAPARAAGKGTTFPCPRAGRCLGSSPGWFTHLAPPVVGPEDRERTATVRDASAFCPRPVQARSPG
ncbi:hypothetical protein GCM10023329_09250 [Streptomyces sanyensis]|uniref:Uncharacterized protein n=1 Tax=Streptomyces sanyensis TaxID=568869 RepID=A0ABP8ZTD3_9ACTN